MGRRGGGGTGEAGQFVRGNYKYFLWKRGGECGGGGPGAGGKGFRSHRCRGLLYAWIYIRYNRPKRAFEKLLASTGNEPWGQALGRNDRFNVKITHTLYVALNKSKCCLALPGDPKHGRRRMPATVRRRSPSTHLVPPTNSKYKSAPLVIRLHRH